MLVDKLHFPNHKGKWCRENCDPKKEKSLNDVNSVVCEQKFTYTNRFKNVKCMSSTHFMLYLLYILDAQNLRILGRLKEIKPEYVPKKEESEGNKMDAITNSLKNIRDANRWNQMPFSHLGIRGCGEFQCFSTCFSNIFREYETADWNCTTKVCSVI